MRPEQMLAFGLGHAVLAAVSASVAVFVTMLFLSPAGAPLRAAAGLPVAEIVLPPCAAPAMLHEAEAQPPPEGGGIEMSFSRPKPLDLGPRAPFIPAD